VSDFLDDQTKKTRWWEPYSFECIAALKVSSVTLASGRNWGSRWLAEEHKLRQGQTRESVMVTVLVDDARTARTTRAKREMRESIYISNR
jgi:dihydroxyacetone kinase